MDTMGEDGFSHGMTPDQLKRIRELEKENKLLKEIVIQKEIKGRLKDELLKKKLALKKKRIVRSYIFQGLKREVAFQISGLTKHQYYYQKKKTKQSRCCSIMTLCNDSRDEEATVSNDFVIQEMKQVYQDPDTDYGYQKMKATLQIKGYHINHKKIYRLMREAQLLQEKHQKPSKTRVKYRKVFPSQPFEVLEMDIKFVWVEKYKMHCYILTTIDTFMRIVLHWMVAYSIKNKI